MSFWRRKRPQLQNTQRQLELNYDGLASLRASLIMAKARLEELERKSRTCQWCGTLWAKDDSKPNCSQCGAPKRGG